MIKIKKFTNEINTLIMAMVLKGIGNSSEMNVRLVPDVGIQIGK
jgi:hypothetical protein